MGDPKPLDLDAIEERYAFAASFSRPGIVTDRSLVNALSAARNSAADVPRLIAEVKRLRDALEERRESDRDRDLST